MRNLVFVIWLLGFGFLVEIGTYLNPPTDSSPAAKGVAALIYLVVQVVVALLLYERAPKPQTPMEGQ